jgi:hypothetical protein
VSSWYTLSPRADLGAAASTRASLRFIVATTFAASALCPVAAPSWSICA